MENIEKLIETICEINIIDKSKIQSKVRLNNDKGVLLLFDEKAIIYDINENYVATILLPSNIHKSISFYDVYYAGNELNIIVATRDSYDIACIIDEEQWKIVSQHPTK